QRRLAGVRHHDAFRDGLGHARRPAFGHCNVRAVATPVARALSRRRVAAPRTPQEGARRTSRERSITPEPRLRTKNREPRTENVELRTPNPDGKLRSCLPTISDPPTSATSHERIATTRRSA